MVSEHRRVALVPPMSTIHWFLSEHLLLCRDNQRLTILRRLVIFLQHAFPDLWLSELARLRGVYRRVLALPTCGSVLGNGRIGRLVVEERGVDPAGLVVYPRVDLTETGERGSRGCDTLPLESEAGRWWLLRHVLAPAETANVLPDSGWLFEGPSDVCVGVRKGLGVGGGDGSVAGISRF